MAMSWGSNERIERATAGRCDPPVSGHCTEPQGRTWNGFRWSPRMRCGWIKSYRLLVNFGALMTNIQLAAVFGGFQQGMTHSHSILQSSWLEAATGSLAVCERHFLPWHASHPHQGCCWMFSMFADFLTEATDPPNSNIRSFTQGGAP